MKISIFGLGYVGTVSAACMSGAGHTVIGVDTNPLKVDAICKGTSPVVEPGVEELLRQGVAGGKLSATVDTPAAVLGSDISLLCVGTPSRSNGSLNLDQVFTVGRQIGEALRAKQTYHAVALRSTVLPGTVERLASIIEETSGRQLGADFSVASNPEFLREGNAVEDFMTTPSDVLMADDFWGEVQWAVFRREIRRVLPERDFIDVPPDHDHLVLFVGSRDLRNCVVGILIGKNRVENFDLHFDNASVCQDATHAAVILIPDHEAGHCLRRIVGSICKDADLAMLPRRV